MKTFVHCIVGANNSDVPVKQNHQLTLQIKIVHMRTHARTHACTQKHTLT